MRPRVIGRPSSPAPVPSGERGAATVEFALVLPLLLAILMGTVQVGQAWNTKVSLSQAVREGARAAALGGSPAEARAAVTGSASDLVGSRLTVTTPAAVCDESLGQNVVVRGAYRYSFDVPLLPTWDVTLSSASTMRCGG